MAEWTFKRVYDGDSDWGHDHPILTCGKNLHRIKDVLEDVGPILVEHWHYYGSRSPDRLVFDEFDDFREHLMNNAIAGDSVHVWSMPDVCTDENRLVHGKCPDEQGLVPRSGAY